MDSVRNFFARAGGFCCLCTSLSNSTVDLQSARQQSSSPSSFRQNERRCGAVRLCNRGSNERRLTVSAAASHACFPSSVGESSFKRQLSYPTPSHRCESASHAGGRPK